jgi:ubiquinone/menaquinone biosynthesis C-methylase UbiE
MHSPARKTVLLSDAGSHTRAAWTAFWSDPAQSRCVAGAEGIWRELSAHWSALARTFPSGARVLDLGCGAGAVARVLVQTRHDLHVSGVDFARIPLLMSPRVELLPDTPMESLPFAARSFAAVVSQFGYEYAQADRAVAEMSRVLLPGATLCLLVHHAGSEIVATNRVRLQVLNAFAGDELRVAFAGADAAGFEALLGELCRRHPQDDLLAQLARALPARMQRPVGERQAIWRSIEDALEPERCLAQALDACCVAPSDIDEWMAPLRRAFDMQPPALLGSATLPIAWQVFGRAR